MSPGEHELSLIVSLIRSRRGDEESPNYHHGLPSSVRKPRSYDPISLYADSCHDFMSNNIVVHPKSKVEIIQGNRRWPPRVFLDGSDSSSFSNDGDIALPIDWYLGPVSLFPQVIHEAILQNIELRGKPWGMGQWDCSLKRSYTAIYKSHDHGSLGTRLLTVTHTLRYWSCWKTTML